MWIKKRGIMSVTLERQKLQGILEDISVGQLHMSREAMVGMIDSFNAISNANGADWEKYFRESCEWMDSFLPLANPQWLEVLHTILLDPPAENIMAYQQEEFALTFNHFLEKLAAQFPNQSQSIFGPDVKGFNTPD